MPDPTSPNPGTELPNQSPYSGETQQPAPQAAPAPDGAPQQQVANQIATPGSEPSDVQTILTILALIFFTPLGVLFMWMWMNWSTPIKWAITIVLLVLPIVFVILFFGTFMAFMGPMFMEGAQCVSECNAQYAGDEAAMEACMEACGFTDVDVNYDSSMELDADFSGMDEAGL